MNTLHITVEGNQVISRFNGEGEGTAICGYVSDQQVEEIIARHNESEKINPSRQNAKAIRG